jgi:hypothetical protein
MFQSLGRALAAFLTRPDPKHQPIATSEPEVLLPALRRGDVLLVEGSSRVSSAIKYLTQSTWSHRLFTLARRCRLVIRESQHRRC